MHTDKINAKKRQIFNGTIACVRRRGDKIHSKILDVGILEKSGKMGRQGILVFY
jgi:hypothetical protein